MSEAPARTTTPLTIDLPTDVVERLGALAERTGGTAADLVGEAIAVRLISESRTGAFSANLRQGRARS
ncbi:MAG TPA: hypothetical protein VFH48_23130 [Chloroflexota bacterium]|nr:hypothetical protein [Chloroflexota bacterium]